MTMSLIIRVLLTGLNLAASGVLMVLVSPVFGVSEKYIGSWYQNIAAGMVCLGLVIAAVAFLVLTFLLIWIDRWG